MKAGNVREGLQEKASLEQGSREAKGHMLVAAEKETSAPSSR